MSDEFLGLLKPEEESNLGKILDEIIDFKKVFKDKAWLGLALETVDGKVFTMSIKALDDKLADKMPQNYKPEARVALLALIAKDWETVVNTAPGLLNKPIDIPGIDEDVELAILTGLVQVVYFAALAYANKQLTNK